MQHIDLTALRYFSETAECGSIRLAAGRLHITPSAVSRRIAKLEQQLDTSLFERHASGVSLTASGQILANEVKTVYAHLWHVREMINDLAGQRRGDVTLCCMEGAVDGWISQVVADYRSRYPGVQFNLQVSSTDASIEALVDGSCDIAVVFKAPRKTEIIVVNRGLEPLMVFANPGHQLAARSSLDLSTVLQHDLVLPDVRFGLRQVIDLEARKLDLAPRLAITANTIALTRSIARETQLLTILPYLSAKHDCELGLLKAIPIRRPRHLHAEIELCVRKGRPFSIAAQGMLNALDSSFRQFVQGA